MFNTPEKRRSNPKNTVFPTGREFFIIQKQGTEDYIFVGIREMILDKARETMRQEVALGNGIVFHPKGSVTVQKSVLDASCRVSGSSIPLVGHIRTVIGKAGWGIFFVVLGPEKDLPQYGSAPMACFTNILNQADSVAEAVGRASAKIKVDGAFQGT